MKKIIFFIVNFVAFFGYGQKITLPTDAENMQLKGKVKQVIELTIHENGRIMDSTITRFNEKGFFTEINKYSYDTNNDSKVIKEEIKRVFNYKDAHIVAVTIYEKGKEKGKYIQKLNNEGWVSEIIEEETPNSRLKVSYTYNKNYTKAIVLNTIDGLYHSKSLYTFDVQGRVLTLLLYLSDEAKPISKSSYTYNDKGFIASIDLEMYTDSIRKTIVFKYQYDAKGSATAIKHYIKDILMDYKKRTIEYY